MQKAFKQHYAALKQREQNCRNGLSLEIARAKLCNDQVIVRLATFRGLPTKCQVALGGHTVLLLVVLAVTFVEALDALDAAGAGSFAVISCSH